MRRKRMHGRRRRRTPILNTTTGLLGNAGKTTGTSDSKIKKYVPGEDGPRAIGGSAPNPAKTAYNIGKTLIKAGKALYKKIKK